MGRSQGVGYASCDTAHHCFYPRAIYRRHSAGAAAGQASGHTDTQWFSVDATNHQVIQGKSMRNISFKGLALGIVAIVVLDVVVGIGLKMALGGPLVSEGMTAQQIREATTALTHTTNYLAWSLILGALATVVGGYIAARVGKEAPYLNAGLLGVFGTVLTVLLGGDFPLWFALGGIAVVLPAALLGGYFAARGSGSKP